jgi:hypothetical protein
MITTHWRNMVMTLERIKAEEEALEKEMFGDQTTEEEVSTEQQEEAPQESEVIEQELSPEEESYKKRYSSFKASADKTIYNLRREIASFRVANSELQNQIDNLSLKLAQLTSTSNDPLKDIITDDDVINIGEEAIDVIKRVTKQASEASTAPLQDEIKKLKMEKIQEQKRLAEERHKVAYNRFLINLEEIVPDYAAINLDSKFKEFMEGHDDLTGQSRLASFRQAEEYLDAQRVADFFLTFKESQPRSKKEKLEENMTPTGSSSAEVGKGKVVETFTARQVEDFFNDIARGVYRNRQKEANELETRISKAYIEGRIIG